MNKFDEEKAKSLWYHFCTEKNCDGYDDCKLCPKAQAHPQLIEMAKWKDEQFKSILKLIYSKTLSIEKDVVIEQILKTQFDEEIDRNELNKEELKELFGKLKEVKL